MKRKKEKEKGIEGGKRKGGREERMGGREATLRIVVFGAGLKTLVHEGDS